MLSLANFELRRTLRTPRFLIMTMFMPVAMNIVFVQLNGSRLSGDKLQSFAVEYMMNMAAFATVSACLSTAGHRLAQERGTGWFTYLTLTPLRPIDIVGAKIISAICLGVPAVVGVFLSGVLVNGVPFHPVQLVVALLLVTAGSTAFAALGVVIGLMTTPDTAYAAAMAALMFFAIIGGLWMPADALPSWLHALTQMTPSYQIATASKAIMNGTSMLPASALTVFFTWTAVLTGLALVAFRRCSAATR